MSEGWWGGGRRGRGRDGAMASRARKGGCAAAPHPLSLTVSSFSSSSAAAAGSTPSGDPAGDASSTSSACCAEWGGGVGANERGNRRKKKKQAMRAAALSPPPSLARSRPRPYLVRPGGRRVVEAIVRIIRVRPVAHVEAGGGGGQLAVAGWGRGRGRGRLVILGLALGQGLKHVFGCDAAHGGQRAGVSGCRWVCGGWPEWADRPGNALGTGGGRPRLARATGEKTRGGRLRQREAERARFTSGRAAVHKCVCAHRRVCGWTDTRGWAGVCEGVRVAERGQATARKRVRPRVFASGGPRLALPPPSPPLFHPRFSPGCSPPPPPPPLRRPGRRYPPRPRGTPPP